MNISGGRSQQQIKDPFSFNSTFKSVSREKNPAWGNRFVRDHNDLHYEANPESISNRLKKNAKTRQPQPKVEENSPLRKFQTSSYKTLNSVGNRSTRNRFEAGNETKGLKLSHYMQGVQDFQEKVREGLSTAPQSGKKRWTGEEGWENDYGLGKEESEAQVEVKKGSNLFGLSRFEYNQTIRGKIDSRSNHHIDFDKNKTNKIDNRNKIWYGEPQGKNERSSNSLASKKIHPFHSYSTHNLFGRNKRMSEDNGCGYGGLLDKFYETTSPEHYRVTHENTLQAKVNYPKMTPRAPLKKQLGTNLDYDTQGYKTLRFGDGRRPVMEMSRSQRKLVFSRQVISSSRGCFR